MGTPHVTKIGFKSLDIFPVFVDYDMINMKCRGLSAKLDLFSYGALTAEMEKLKGKGLKFAVEEGILIKKDCLLFDGGFFLFDFSYICEHTDKFLKKLANLNIQTVYMENSERFDLTPLFDKAKGCRIELLEFGNA